MVAIFKFFKKYFWRSTTLSWWGMCPTLATPLVTALLFSLKTGTTAAIFQTSDGDPWSENVMGISSIITI